MSNALEAIIYASIQDILYHLIYGLGLVFTLVVGLCIVYWLVYCVLALAHGNVCVGFVYWVSRWSMRRNKLCLVEPYIAKAVENVCVMGILGSLSSLVKVLMSGVFCILSWVGDDEVWTRYGARH